MYWSVFLTTAGQSGQSLGLIAKLSAILSIFSSIMLGVKFVLFKVSLDLTYDYAKESKICVFEVFISSIWRFIKHLSCFKSLYTYNYNSKIVFKYVQLKYKYSCIWPQAYRQYTKVMKTMKWQPTSQKKLSTLTLRPICAACKHHRMCN